MQPFLRRLFPGALEQRDKKLLQLFQYPYYTDRVVNVVDARVGKLKLHQLKIQMYPAAMAPVPFILNPQRPRQRRTII
jgi:hypothetical protein